MTRRRARGPLTELLIGRLELLLWIGTAGSALYLIRLLTN